MTFEKMMKNIEDQLYIFEEGFAEERGIPDVAHLIAQDKVRYDVVIMMYEQFREIGDQYPDHALDNCIEYLDMQIRWDTNRATVISGDIDNIDDYDRLVIDGLRILKFCTEYDFENE